MRVFLSVLSAATVAMAGWAITPAQVTGDPGRSSRIRVEPGSSTTDLTLERALERAVDASPTLAAGQHALAAADARVDQAGVFPNPELEIEIENFGGKNELRHFDAAERTVMVSQPILLGGKLKRQRAVADAQQALVSSDLRAARLDVVFETTTAFYRVLIAQHRTTLGEELFALAQRISNTVAIRVDAGKVSPVEATRAKIEVGQARIRLTRARRELQIARDGLAAMWGSATPDFEKVVGEMPNPAKPPAIDSLRLLLAQTPEIARLEGQVLRQESIQDFQESLRIPDLQVSIGTRRFEELGQSAWVAGVSLPLPLFDRNRAARKAAKFETERTRHQAMATRRTLETDLGAQLVRLRSAARETRLVSREVLPAANAAFETVETGYREGKFGFLDVLDAQRGLFEARSLLLDSQQEFLVARTRLERRIGRPLATLVETVDEARRQDPGERR